MAVLAAPTDEIGHVNPHGTDSMWASIMAQAETVPELQWPQAVNVYRRMPREDSRVSSLLAAIKLPIRRTNWMIDPNGADPEVVDLVAESFGLQVRGASGAPRNTKGRARNRFSWSRHLNLALSSIQYGHSYFEQVYRYDERSGRMYLRKLAPRPQSTIAKINVALDGGLESIEQSSAAGVVHIRNAVTLPPPIPVSRLVAYVRDPDPGDWLGESILRPAYKHWLLKDEMMRIEAATARRNGMGLPVYYGSDDEELRGTDLETGRAMTRSVRAGMGSGMAVPAGADFKLLGVQGNLPDIRASIDAHDKAIALSGLAHFLNLDKGGSYALASVQSDTFVQSVQALAEDICDVTNMHVIEDLVDVNFGEDTQAPRLVFDEIGSRQDAVASALAQLVSAGILFPDRTLEESIRQSYGLPSKQLVPNSQLADAPSTTSTDTAETDADDDDALAAAETDADDDALAAALEARTEGTAA